MTKIHYVISVYLKKSFKTGPHSLKMLKKRSLKNFLSEKLK